MDLQSSKSVDRFLYDRDRQHERVNSIKKESWKSQILLPSDPSKIIVEVFDVGGF